MKVVLSRKSIIRILALVAVLLALAAVLWKPWDRGISWREHYRRNSKDPYGTYVLFETLQKTKGGNKNFKIIADSLPGTLPQGKAMQASYVFVGDEMYINERSIDTLLNFVADGNSAFISARYMPYYLVKSVTADLCETSFYDWEGLSFHEDTVVWLQLEHPSLALEKSVPCRLRYYKKYIKNLWPFFPTHSLCLGESDATVLGNMNASLANFVRIPYGNGFVYLHSTPLIFTNYHMLRPEVLRYAENALSHLDDGPVYWDERSTMPSAFSAPLQPRNKALSSKSPLQYILSQAPLAWAWYLLLAMGLLFLIMRSRRRQRIVPVLEPNTNTSMEFVATIGRLYFLQNNHYQLCLQKGRLFQQFLRERYGLANTEPDEAFLEKLAAKSQVPRKLIDTIFLMQTNIQTSGRATENTLIQFHGLLEEFYHTCK